MKRLNKSFRRSHSSTSSNSFEGDDADAVAALGTKVDADGNYIPAEVTDKVH